MLAELPTLVSAFLVGLVSSTHCAGMCGGIVGALTLASEPRTGRSSWSVLPYILAYNTGRIGSYAIAGGLVGFLGAHMFGVAPEALRLAPLLAAVITILLGLYLSGWWMGLGILERLGAQVWKYLEPLGRRLMPINHPAKALLFGSVWGWLPCGLVYSALAWSLSSESAAQGAMLMTAFGLGTLPMLLVMGTASGWAGRITRQLWLRRSIGAGLIVFGVYLLIMTASSHGELHRHLHRLSTE